MRCREELTMDGRCWRGRARMLRPLLGPLLLLLCCDRRMLLMMLLRGQRRRCRHC